ncbi:HAL/PAL/TAL family ammonia-lyase [Epibacterium sp. Ofav1-8]|uniref:HAL/PAL/TAL family ammonia-lyase n=1 Tax=Epibacterium sp. Ofav1-8 TaxID=2917735 RepID=UPI001EF53735|nr:histidine ammonia-lyase [Epibacterium sp. Ofav1-8]MCG7625801.1 histidine ammonia-lyase [Epibacterium sp. Ofav1-8]
MSAHAALSAQDHVLLDRPLSPFDIEQIAKGADLVLSDAAIARIKAARDIVDAIVDRGIRGYGINTGVGALCDVIIGPADQSALSHNILFSHACGVGAPLPPDAARAIMAAQINNFCHGRSGVRWETVETLLALLNAGITPVMPSQGSVGYLVHSACIGLLVIGEGEAMLNGDRISGAQALRHIGRAPLKLGAKEGLSLVNGTPCATGLAALAFARLSRLVDWADAAAAFSYELLGRQSDPFEEQGLGLRMSEGMRTSANTVRTWLSGRGHVAADRARTQDPLSLRAVPQVHGSVRDELGNIAEILRNELHSVTDNPVVCGSPEAPVVSSQANAVGAAIGFAADRLAMIAAQLGAISERRIDRMVNPLVSDLPPFLSADGGRCSGLMIAQYSASALCGENRRLSVPASLDGGVTSALQEDILTHATPAAEKALHVMQNLFYILAIELLCGAQARDLHPLRGGAEANARLYARLRGRVAVYQDDRPLNRDIEDVAALLRDECACAPDLADRRPLRSGSDGLHHPPL